MILNRNMYQVGYGSPFFQGIRHQRGGGFWSKAFSGAILPALRFLGRRAADVGGDVLSDVVAGQDPLEAITTRVKEQGKQLATKASDRAKKFAQTGKGRKRKVGRPKKVKKTRKMKSKK